MRRNTPTKDSTELSDPRDAHVQEATADTGPTLEECVEVLRDIYDWTPSPLDTRSWHKELAIDRRAYLELNLVVAALLGSEAEGCLRSDRVYEKLSDHARGELDPSRGGAGLPDVLGGHETLEIWREGEEQVRCRRGPLAAKAALALSRFDGSAAEIAAAVDRFVQTGNADRLESLFAPGDSSSKDASSEVSSSYSSGTTVPARELFSEDPSPGEDEATGSSSDGFSDSVSSGDSSAKTIPIGNSEEIGSTKGANITNGTTNESTGEAEGRPGAIESATKLHVTRSSIEVKSVFDGDERGFAGGAPWDSYGTDGETPCGIERGKTGARRRLEALPDPEIEDLKSRTPSGNCPRIAIPTTDLYDKITSWRPQIRACDPFAAVLQLILFSWRRDEDWHTDGECTGMPLPYETVFGCFGLSPSMAYFRGLNAEMLLELYRRDFDPEFDWTAWNEAKDKARVVKDHGIPDPIISEAKKVMLSPNDHDDWTYLIGGNSASNRQFTAKLREERREAIEDQTPAVAPPPATRAIKQYLNGLAQQRFGHGSYGILRPDVIEEAAEEARRRISGERRRDQELRKLYWMRRYPQPLYLPCDRSPRLKADHHNQAMNLPSEILRAVYTDRDYELDLAKAHLAGLVAVAEREGIGADVLRGYLEESMEEEDLWTELASTFSAEHNWDPEAARSAAKKFYAGAYGASDSTILHEMSKAYGEETGEYRAFEAFEPVLRHELADEIRRIRDRLEAIITARGGLEDADGRYVPSSKWEGVKAEESRWRGVLAYVNASYEQKLMEAAFEVAIEEQKRDARPRFRIWLYQSDGFTMRVSSKASHSRQVERLQDAVDEKADELGVPTRLEVDYAGP